MGEPAEQVFLRVAQQVEELSRNVSDLLIRQNTLDVQIGNLVAASQNVDGASRHRVYTNGYHETQETEPSSGLMRSSTGKD